MPAGWMVQTSLDCCFVSVAVDMWYDLFSVGDWVPFLVETSWDNTTDRRMDCRSWGQHEWQTGPTGNQA